MAIFSLAQRGEDLLHEIQNHREVQIEGDIQELGDPGDDEERDEGDDQTDDRIANGVHGLLDLVFIARRENEGDASDDDEGETKDRGDDQRKGDERGDDFEDGAALQKVS
jgi:hypothetical protein